MRIAIEANARWRNRAGTGTYVRNLFGAMEELAPQHTYLYLTTSAADASGSLDIGERGRLRRLVNGIRQMLWLQAGLPLKLRQLQAEVFHAPAMIGPFWQPCPTVFTIHDLAILEFPHTIDPLWRSYVSVNLRLALTRAKAIITISDSTRQDVIRHFSVRPDLVRVVHHGCDPRFRPQVKGELRASTAARLGLPDSFILYVGTLEPRKNVPRLLRAFRTLKSERGVPHKLVIVGERGWLYDDIFQELEDLGLKEEVAFTGYVDLDDLPVIYGLSDMLVYPSLYEGFGLPPLEAMACGCPVVTSAVSSLPEVVGEAALCVDPYDVRAIKEAMETILFHPDRRAELVDRGLERAKLFSWQRAASETLEVYSAIARAGKREGER